MQAPLHRVALLPRPAAAQQQSAAAALPPAAAPHGNAVRSALTFGRFLLRSACGELGTWWFLFFLVVAPFQAAGSALSPTDSFTVLIPLAGVLALGLAREALAELRSVRADKEVNAAPVVVLRAGAGGAAPAWQAATWGALVEGDVVRLACDEAAPADLALLATGSAGGRAALCSAAQLTGRAALVERAVPLAVAQALGLPGGGGGASDDPAALAAALQGRWLACPPPSADLRAFEVALEAAPADGAASGEASSSSSSSSAASAAAAGAQGAVSVPASGALLRGEVLRGTPWAVGVVAYAGARCKAQAWAGAAAAAAAAPWRDSRKPNPTQRKLTHLTLALLALLALFVVAMVLGYGIFTQVYLGRSAHWYLPFLVPKRMPLDEILGLWASSTLLLNQLVPISLLLTPTLARLVQEWALERLVVEEAWGEGGGAEGLPLARVANSGATCEVLGQVGTIVTDKTGTLTREEYVLRALAVAGQFGVQTFALGGSARARAGAAAAAAAAAEEDHPGSAAGLDAKGAGELAEAAAVPGGGAGEALLCMALCHEAQWAAARGQGGAPLSAASPEETALLDGLAGLGHCAVAGIGGGGSGGGGGGGARTVALRSGSGAAREYTVLAVNPYVPGARCMSVLVQGARGSAPVLWWKGAEDALHGLVSGGQRAEQQQQEAAAAQRPASAAAAAPLAGGAGAGAGAGPGPGRRRRQRQRRQQRRRAAPVRVAARAHAARRGLCSAGHARADAGVPARERGGGGGSGGGSGGARRRGRRRGAGAPAALAPAAPGLRGPRVHAGAGRAPRH